MAEQHVFGVKIPYEKHGLEEQRNLKNAKKSTPLNWNL